MQLLKSDNGFSSGFAILMVALFLLGAIVWGLWPKGKSFEKVTGWSLPWQQEQEKGDKKAAPDGEFFSIEERLQIEKWITENRLNQYGDPADTLYAGGTPLFDERTGKTMSRYEYILKKYPNRPWRK